ncbi:MAG: hypothetical protein AW10_01946 [Candidatus Accumulibacter appositus]|uniref:Uncharacterized protein n=1 Tax=Candidatus Accumulibacter appositus TaxID=1454003 RepID=A0A011QMS1_9PROT|nr:MAG: hypothetical protein AW10_01946 [Candidatus Accumulibacter appositus]
MTDTLAKRWASVPTLRQLAAVVLEFGGGEDDGRVTDGFRFPAQVVEAASAPTLANNPRRFEKSPIQALHLRNQAPDFATAV